MSYVVQVYVASYTYTASIQPHSCSYFIAIIAQNVDGENIDKFDDCPSRFSIETLSMQLKCYYFT